MNREGGANAVSILVIAHTRQQFPAIDRATLHSLATDEPLHIVHGPCRVDCGLVLGSVSNQALAVGEGHVTAEDGVWVMGGRKHLVGQRESRLVWQGQRLSNAFGPQLPKPACLPNQNQDTTAAGTSWFTGRLDCSATCTQFKLLNGQHRHRYTPLCLT